MKASLVFTIVLGLLVLLFVARRRIWTSLKLVAAAFLALNLVRFLRASDDLDSFVTLAATLAVFGAVWLALWAVTRLVERHRALHPAPPRQRTRRPRWRL